MSPPACGFTSLDGRIAGLFNAHKILFGTETILIMFCFVLRQRITALKSAVQLLAIYNKLMRVSSHVWMAFFMPM